MLELVFSISSGSMARDEDLLSELVSWHSDWSKAKVLVIGLGETGFSVADTLNELGAKQFVVSAASDEKTLDILDVLEISYLVDSSEDAILKAALDFAANLVITSPGIRPDNSLIVSLQEQGITIWTDIDLAWRLRDKFNNDQQWICITGTNGKTTTTELTEAMLSASGVRAASCGNIGTPILDCIRDPAEFEVLVVELSSFQLHYLDRIEPFSSACLNVAEDHIDWHGSFEKYRLTKGKIYFHTQVACVYNLSDQSTEDLVQAAEVKEGARAIGFGLGIPAKSNVGYVEDLLVDRAFLEDRADKALEVASLKDLEGFGVLTPHFLSNIAAATALARSYGAPPAACRQALRNFLVSPHRIQLILEKGGIRYVNDSKATNAHAAAASLSSFDSVIWIVGGLLKGVEISPLISKFASRLRGVAIIGKERDAITTAFGKLAPSVPLFEVEDSRTVMTDAVKWAMGIAEPGDVVLLAPAAASMDQFKDYQDRGTSFSEAVLHLSGAAR